MNDISIIHVEHYNILGRKVKAIRERYSDEYLDSKRFQSRCLRCCFYQEKKDFFDRTPRFCNFIRCSGCYRDEQTHFELDE